MEHPKAVENPAGKKVNNTAASEVSKEPQRSSLEMDASQVEEEPANEMPSEKAEELAAPATPLKEDNISKEAITEKSPEVGIRVSPTELVPISLFKDEVRQQSSEETHQDNLEKAKYLQHEDFAPYQTGIEPILHELATASHSLQSISARFLEMKVDLDHVVSNFASLTQSLEVVAKKRDEQRSLIDKPTAVEMAQKPSAASVDDMLLLKLSVERVQSHIEQVSVQIISCFEKSFHGFMQPIWDSSPEAFKEPYICSVVSERMFSGFENENFMVNEAPSTIFDLETLRKESMRKYLELCNENAQDLIISDYLFDHFAWVRKSLVLEDVKKIMLVATVNLDKVLMSGDIWERLEDLAKEVWALHKLYLYMGRRARILRVEKGVRFDERWMEAVNSPPPPDDEHAVEEVEVEFMVMPGFQVMEVMDTLVSPCRVYVVENNTLLV